MAADVVRLMDEQLQARPVYVDPELETNAELDAITANVVDELKAMQAEALRLRPADDRQEVEIELIKHLRELLEKMVSTRRQTFLRHKISLIQRRVTKLFFSSELLADPKISRKRETPFAHADEALYHAIRRHEPAIRAELRSMDFTDRALQKVALDQFELFRKQLASQLLMRSRPELEALLKAYGQVLLVWLLGDFRSSLGEFCWEVIRESRVAHGNDLSYKILEPAFPAFRKAFEHHFLERLLEGVEQPLGDALTSDEAPSLRPETLSFAADPRIFAEIGSVMCNSVYFYLHGEGFLDLPVTWQHATADDDD